LFSRFYTKFFAAKANGEQLALHAFNNN